MSELARRTLLAALTVALLTAVALSSPSGAAAERLSQGCGSVTITPNSGDGLFSIRVRNVSCRTARRTLRRWGRGGYEPSSGPDGYSCRVVKRYAAGNARLKCRSGVKTISFDTGL